MSEPQTGRKSCKRIKQGTVLAIPATSGKWVIGQVLHAEINFYIGIALTEFDEFPAPSQIHEEELVLFSWTTDGEVYRGGWWVLGDAQPPENFEFPKYRVCYAGEDAIVSFLGEYVRPFNSDLDRNLRSRISRSPKLVQNAVLVAFGVSNRQEDFDNMKVI